MISKKQLRANRENAKLGGVKTPEGKEISRFNAITNGIFRQSLTDYEEGFYPGFVDDLTEHYQPEGLIENILVERISIHYLQLRRIQKAETEYIKSKLNPHIVKSQADITLEGLEDKHVIKEGYEPRITDKDVRELNDTYARYETTIENRFFKSIHELEKTQKLRRSG